MAMKGVCRLHLFAVLLLCPVSARPQQLPAQPVSGGAPAASPSTAQQRAAGSSRNLTAAQQKLKTFRTMFVSSDTVYLNNEVLEKAMMKRFEFHAWNIVLGEKSSADVWVTVTRPFLTFDWRYRMTDAATGLELGAGRIVAWDGEHAAEGIAADVARTIGRVRALPTHLLAAFADEPNARKFEVTYENGSEGPRHGARLTISVSAERIVGRRQSRVLFVIPTQAISSVGYNPHTTDPSKQWEAFWDYAFSNAYDANSAMGALMLLPVALVGDILLKQAQSTEHLCEVTWIDNRAVRNVTLKLDSETVQEFLDVVSAASDRKATDIQADTAALRQAIEREGREGRFIPLQLDKKTAVGWKVLEPGAYRVVVVERQPDRAIAYFIGPNTGSQSGISALAAPMPVMIEPGPAAINEPQVRYRETNGIVSIEEIATADKTLRFRAIPLPFAAEPQIPEDMEELLAEAALKPGYRSIRVTSDTVYLKRETMEQALAQHPAFIEWELKVAQPAEEADLALLVTRPFLTFDWKYAVTEVKTGKKLTEGKIAARDGGRAATLIADQLVDALKASAAQEMKNETK